MSVLGSTKILCLSRPAFPTEYSEASTLGELPNPNIRLIKEANGLFLCSNSESGDGAGHELVEAHLEYHIRSPWK